MQRPIISSCVQLSEITVNHFQHQTMEKCQVQEKATIVRELFHALMVIILSDLNHEPVRKIMCGVDLQPLVLVGLKESLFIQSCNVHF